MSFKEFDLSDYITALEDFKNNSTDDVIKHWGSIENFDMFIQKTQLPPSEDGGLLWSKDHFLRLKVACRLKPVSFATKVA